MRDIVGLACSACKRRTYTKMRDTKKHTTKLEFNKYCRFCRKHTLHKEVKV
jgi:large subunit ribosomal protein L33